MADKNLLEGIFPDDFIGTAVELGAGDGVHWSTTYDLEQKGWKVLCIEPCEVMYELCRTRRSNVVRAAVMDESLDRVELIVRTIPGYVHHERFVTVGGLNQYFIKALFDENNLTVIDTATELVRQERLDVLLEEAGFTSLDLASIDVDGEEMKVLAGFTLNRWQPKAVLIENIPEDQAMRKWFEDRGYYLHVHHLPNNLYLRKD